jgi:L-malate glycosyltransferase
MVISKTRILHCVETIGSGGVEQRKLLLARGLVASRYDQALICTKAIGALPQQFKDAGVTIHEVGDFQGILNPSPYRKAYEIIRKYQPHIIHGAVYEGVALAAIAGRIGRVPIIIGEETSDPIKRRWKGHLLYRLLCSMTHHMVGVSPSVRDYLINRLNIPPHKVTLIKNAVSEAPAASPEEVRALREAVGLKPEHFVIGTVGRLFDSHKRVSDLIRAVSQIQQLFPAVRLLIVGSGPDEEMLRRFADERGVSSKVCFVGYQGNPRPFYQLMNVFALASAYEAFGLVLAEAMFAGLPVVATRVGGVPSVVEDGLTGVLVPPYTPVRLAEEFMRLATDEKARQAMGARGQKRARQEYSSARYVAEVDRLYQRLMARA